jgi:hypothetical protein
MLLRKEVDVLRGSGKEESKVSILAKSIKRLIKQRKPQGMSGGCKEYYNSKEGEQSMLCVEGRKYEDDEKEMGALCFTRRVRRTGVPHDQQKYDGSEEPRLWLSDYLQAVQILGGTRATTMQSLQLHLTGAARS